MLDHAHELCEDEDYVIMITGSWSGEAKAAIEDLRAEGYRVGVARIRFIRPWPEEEVSEIASRVRGIIVFDRAVSFGSKGPLFLDVATTVNGRTSLRGVIAGLGGTEVRKEHFIEVVKDFVNKVEEYGKVYEPEYWLLPDPYRNRPLEEVAPKWW
jgi:pyruvate ferredoxin oxidoreductase alpha subunit